MSNNSDQKNSTGKNTSSGQGALGMGGQPSDDPRDLERGGEGRVNSDTTDNTGPVGGAFGGTGGVEHAGGTAGSQTVGPMGKAGAMPDVDNAIRKAREGARD